MPISTSTTMVRIVGSGMLAGSGPPASCISEIGVPEPVRIPAGRVTVGKVSPELATSAGPLRTEVTVIGAVSTGFVDRAFNAAAPAIGSVAFPGEPLMSLVSGCGMGVRGPRLTRETRLPVSAELLELPLAPAVDDVVSLARPAEGFEPAEVEVDADNGADSPRGVEDGAAITCPEDRPEAEIPA